LEWARGDGAFPTARRALVNAGNLTKLVHMRFVFKGFPGCGVEKYGSFFRVGNGWTGIRQGFGKWSFAFAAGIVFPRLVAEIGHPADHERAVEYRPRFISAAAAMGGGRAAFSFWPLHGAHHNPYG
jgi:hypothetical protein